MTERSVPTATPWSGAVNLFRAEWIKVAGNRWVTLGLLWIFPIVATLFIGVLALVLALDTSARANFGADETFRWTDMAVGVWNIPNHPFLRVVILGFTAVVFAGEYQWQTWKNTVPRNRRTALIVTKFVTVGAFVLMVFVLLSAIVAVGWGGLMAIAGQPYGPPLSGEVLRSFARDYLVQASVMFTSTVISAGYAALAGMLTRSILGGVLVSFLITVADGFSIVGLLIAGWFLDFPDLVQGYRFVPTYNILNVLSWINDGKALEIPVYETTRHAMVLSDPLAFSLIVLAGWVVGVIAMTALLFRRQDIAG